jgi:hypothetical protein
LANGAIDEDINPIPNINIENPIKNVPTGFLLEKLLLEVISIITPASASKGEKDSGFNILRKKLVL